MAVNRFPILIERGNGSCVSALHILEPMLASANSEPTTADRNVSALKNDQRVEQIADNSIGNCASESHKNETIKKPDGQHTE